eukprot:UN33918
MAFFSHFTLTILAKAGHIVKGNSLPTYPELANAAFGWRGKLFAWFGIMAMTIGVCGSYLVFVGQSL